MKHTTKKQPKASTKRHPEYGTIGRDVDLGIAMLIAETEDGQYEPNGPVATINEAVECAQHDMASRTRDLELGGEPTCPAIYRVWSRDYEGEYTIVYEMDAATMKPAQPARRRS